MPSRRHSIELSTAEIRTYLDEQKTLIIVSNGPGGFPHPMPMWFYRDADDRINCTTFSKAQKVLNYQRDPRASLLVESGTEYAQLKGVVIYARAEIIADINAVTDTLMHINRRMANSGAGADAEISAEQLAALRTGLGSTASKRVLLRFAPERYVSWDHSRLGGRY